jgi:hypothetical protein
LPSNRFDGASGFPDVGMPSFPEFEPGACACIKEVVGHNCHFTSKTG